MQSNIDSPIPQNPGYRVLLTVPLPELLPFLRQQLRTLTPWSVGYWLATGLLVAGIGYQIFRLRPSADSVLLGLGQGFALFFLLVLPLHEAIHAALYKLAGAPAVRFGANWRQFTFYAHADGFVVGPGWFRVIALGPCLLLNSTLLLALLLAPSAQSWPILGALLLHTGGCFGDVALVNFFYLHRGEPLATMDDVANQVVYFLRETRGLGE